MDSVAGDEADDQTRRMPNARIPAPDVGARIRARRETVGISQEELAARFRARSGSSMTQNTIGRWERQGRLSVGELRVVAEVLGMPASWFLG